MNTSPKSSELRTSWRGSAAERGGEDLKASNLTGIGGSGSKIRKEWQPRNILEGVSADVVYGPGESVFNSKKGANIYYRYKDGILTDEPLWPWPMNQRI